MTKKISTSLVERDARLQRDSRFRLARKAADHRGTGHAAALRDRFLLETRGQRVNPDDLVASNEAEVRHQTIF